MDVKKYILRKIDLYNACEALCHKLYLLFTCKFEVRLNNVNIKEF